MVHHTQKSTTKNSQTPSSNNLRGDFSASTDVMMLDPQQLTHNMNPESILQLQRTIGNQATQNLLMRQKITSKKKQQSNAIQRVDIDDPNWSTAASIARSGEGAEGVIFVTFGDGRLIVKFIDDAAPAAFAEQVISKVGIKRAQSRYLPNDDSDVESAAIRKLIVDKFDNISEEKQEQVTEQLNTRKYIQVQEMVQGVSGARMDARQKAAVLSNAAILQDMGRLAVTDAFLGNYDRITNSSINTGNFMIGDSEGPSLIAIDNDAEANVGSTKGVRGQDLDFVMNPDNIHALAQSLVVKLTNAFTALPEGMEKGEVPDLIDFVAGHMKIGVKDGAEKIMEMIRTDKKFFDNMKALEKRDMPGAKGIKTKNRKLVRAEMKARLKKMKKGYANKSWDSIG